MSAEEMAGTVEPLPPGADEQPPLVPGAGEPEPGPMQTAGHSEPKFVYRIAEKSRLDTPLGPDNPRQELSAAGLSRTRSSSTAGPRQRPFGIASAYIHDDFEQQDFRVRRFARCCAPRRVFVCLSDGCRRLCTLVVQGALDLHCFWLT